MKVLNLKAGDVLIIRTDQHWPIEKIKCLMEWCNQLRDDLKDVSVTMLWKDVDLEVISPSTKTKTKTKIIEISEEELKGINMGLRRITL